MNSDLIVEGTLALNINDPSVLSQSDDYIGDSSVEVSSANPKSRQSLPLQIKANIPGEEVKASTDTGLVSQ